MNIEEYRLTYDTQYLRIIGRFVRQMEKEVVKLQRDHRNLSVGKAWDIVTSAYRKADHIVTGGYKVR